MHLLFNSCAEVMKRGRVMVIKKLTADITKAYLEHNTLDQADIPNLITSVEGALAEISKDEGPVLEVLEHPSKAPT